MVVFESGAVPLPTLAHNYASYSDEIDGLRNSELIFKPSTYREGKTVKRIYERYDSVVGKKEIR